MKIASADQMREMDRLAIEEIRIPGIVLMENAGREAVGVLETCLGDLLDDNIVVVAGKGNNGGDGFVIARHLRNHGAQVMVVLLGRCSDLSGDAHVNARICENMNIPIIESADEKDLDRLECELLNADIIIDAMFGTGLSKPAKGRFQTAIEMINKADAYVMSVDIPSGLSADSPEISGPAVWADFTVTFGLPKPALLLYPAAECAGQIFVVDISIPAEMDNKPCIKGTIIDPYGVTTILAPRDPNTHKGSYGHLLVLAGSPGKTGAAVLAGESALRAGSGLVTIGVPESLNSIFEIKLTEVMTEPLPSRDGKTLDTTSLPAIKSLAEGKSAVLIGPGIGLNPETGNLILSLIRTLTIPVILDADALTLLSREEDPWSGVTAPLILTPHPGEMSRLTGVTTSDLIPRQLEIVPDFASRTGTCVVFKTARTLIAATDGSWTLNITGNPGLASGGSGDVLAGLIGGILARGFSPLQSAACGVFWHGLAADIAVTDIGEHELIAGDILDYLIDARKMVTNHPEYFDGAVIPYNFDPATEIIGDTL